MNHYEELGVSRSASIAEIRQAYKALVRVVHPDQQQDENLRRLSELQLLRLNHLLEILTDPLERRKYDLSLDPFLPVPRPPAAPQTLSLSSIRTVRIRLRFNTGLLVWSLIGAIAVGSLVFWIRSPEPVYSQPAHSYTQAAAHSLPKETGQAPVRAADHAAEVSGSTPADAPKPEERYSSPQRSVEREASHSRAGDTATRAGEGSKRNDPAVLSALRPKINPPPNASAPRTAELRNEAPPPPEMALTPVAAGEPKIHELTPTLPQKPAGISLSGKWLYVPQPDDGKKTMYAPEYIELRLNSRAGLLRGKYHGRYRVSDRTISPEVNFQFEGRQGDSVSVLPWSGTNGAKGELRLKRISEESMEVKWITTTFGSGNTLASGTATLYRSDPPQQ